MNFSEFDLIKRAKDLSHAAHDSISQVRKYTGEPYWVHTDAVADIVASHGAVSEEIAAAHLHDMLEDVFPALIKQGRLSELANLRAVYNQFPIAVHLMVLELTHVFTSEDYPQWNRAKRKEAEIHRLSRVSRSSKFIKLADFYHNTQSIVEHDEGFAKVYLLEKRDTLPALSDSYSEELFNKVVKQLKESLDKLGIV